VAKVAWRGASSDKPRHLQTGATVARRSRARSQRAAHVDSKVDGYTGTLSVLIVAECALGHVAPPLGANFDSSTTIIQNLRDGGQDLCSAPWFAPMELSPVRVENFLHHRIPLAKSLKCEVLEVSNK